MDNKLAFHHGYESYIAGKSIKEFADGRIASNVIIDIASQKFPNDIHQQAKFALDLNNSFCEGYLEAKIKHS